MKEERTGYTPEFVGIHLFDAASGRYFRKNGEWVEDRASAQAFRCASEAIDLAYRASLKHVELLLTFLLPTYREVHMPLSLGQWSGSPDLGKGASFPTWDFGL